MSKSSYRSRSTMSEPTKRSEDWGILLTHADRPVSAALSRDCRLAATRRSEWPATKSPRRVMRFSTREAAERFAGMVWAQLGKWHATVATFPRRKNKKKSTSSHVQLRMF